MAKFNPTKAQRKMIKFIFSRVKAHKENKHDSESVSRMFLHQAQGVASFMWVNAGSVREEDAAKRVDSLLMKIQMGNVIELPCIESIRRREKRHARIKRISAGRKAV